MLWSHLKLTSANLSHRVLQFYCLVCVSTSGYWMSTCSPGVEGKKKDLKNLAAKTRPNNPLGGENISTGAKTAVLCISWLTLMYMPSPLAENSVKQRDKPAPSRKHDHQKRKKKKSVTRKVFSAYIDINLPAKLWRRKLLQCQRGHSTFTGNIPPLVKAQTQKHSPGFKGQ